MTKAKIGDQRFKKKSYMPYIIAAVILLLLIVGVIVEMKALFDIKGNNNDRLNARLPVVQTEWAPTVERLWFKPNKIPSDVTVRPVDRIIAQGDELCIMFTDQDVEPSAVSGTVYVSFNVDFKDYPASDYVPIVRNEFYCIQPVLEKGYHLIDVRTISDSNYTWAIRVE